MDFLFHFQLLIDAQSRDNKKADFRNFLNSSKLPIVAARSCRHTQVMLQTVTLFYIHCDQTCNAMELNGSFYDLLGD
jgi:hypothetical protein